MQLLWSTATFAGWNVSVSASHRMPGSHGSAPWSWLAHPYLQHIFTISHIMVCGSVVPE